MDTGQFMKRKSISGRSVEHISDKRLRTEVQIAQTNGVERVKRFVKVHLYCIVSNLKWISKMSILSSLEKFLRTPMWCRSRDESAPLKVLICQKFGKISIMWARNVEVFTFFKQ